jgi:hypothetical protein
MAEVKTGSEFSNCVILPALSTNTKKIVSENTSKDAVIV